MTTYTETGNGGVVCGGFWPASGPFTSFSPVYLIKATLDPPCLCCATNFFPYGWSDIPPTATGPHIVVPQTLTFDIPNVGGFDSPCQVLSNTMTAYPQLVTIGNTTLVPGRSYGATYVFENPMFAAGGYQGTLQIVGSLLPNVFGTYWYATMTLPVGFQNISYQCRDWRWNTASNVFPFLIGTTSTCGTFLGGSANETLGPVSGTNNVFQVTHPPATASTQSPNGTFYLSFNPNVPPGTHPFTYDSSGNFSFLTGVGGDTGTGHFNFTTGVITLTYGPHGLTDPGTGQVGSPSLQIIYNGTSDYPPSITVNSSTDSISCGCLENGNWCGAFGMRVNNAIFDADTGYKLLPHGDSSIVFTFLSGIAGLGTSSCQCAWENGYCVWFGYPFGLVVGGSAKLSLPTQPYSLVMLMSHGDGSATLSIGLAGPILQANDGKYYQYLDGLGAPYTGQPQSYNDGSGQYLGNWTCTFQESVSFDITHLDCTCRYIEVGGGSGITLIPLRNG
jgi:hypothetical protein